MTSLASAVQQQSIAHEFRNQLFVILGFCELVLEQLPPSDPARQDITAIAAAAERMNEFVDQIRSLERRQAAADLVTATHSKQIS